MIDMSSVSAVPPLLALLIQIEEDGTNSLSMFRLTLIKRHEVNKDNMSFVHKKNHRRDPILELQKSSEKFSPSQE
jgi:hypothetical protein